MTFATSRRSKRKSPATKHANARQVRTLYTDFIGGQVGELSWWATLTSAENMRSCSRKSLPAGAKEPFARIPRKCSPTCRRGLQQIQDARQGQRRLRRREAFAMKDTDPDYPALVMGNYVLGGVVFIAAWRSHSAKRKDCLTAVGSHLGRLDRRPGQLDRSTPFAIPRISRR